MTEIEKSINAVTLDLEMLSLEELSKITDGGKTLIQHNLAVWLQGGAVMELSRRGSRHIRNAFWKLLTISADILFDDAPERSPFLSLARDIALEAESVWYTVAKQQMNLRADADQIDAASYDVLEEKVKTCGQELGSHICSLMFYNVERRFSRMNLYCRIFEEIAKMAVKFETAVTVGADDEQEPGEPSEPGEPVEPGEQRGRWRYVSRC